MKTLTITLTMPCGGASAPQVMGEFDAFAAELAKKQGWKVKASSKPGGKAYDFHEHYLANHPTVTSLEERRMRGLTEFFQPTPPQAA